MDLWSISLSKISPGEDRAFFQDQALSIYTKNFQEARKFGSPGVDEFVAINEALPNFLNSCATFRNFLKSINYDLKSNRIFSQFKIIAPHPSIQNLNLLAIMDFYIQDQDGVYWIIEGKSTKYPQIVSPDQVRWQTELLRYTNTPVSYQGYYLFYNTAKMACVDTRDSLHFSWLRVRDVILTKMVGGASKPTPTSRYCKICPHRLRCPDKHISKPRTETFIDTPSKPKIISLD